MRTLLLFLLLVVWTSSALHAQYVIEYPYLYFSDPYNTLTIGSTYYTLPRPTETYTSVRIRALSPGFAGLISDQYTDHFRNPALDVGGPSSEAFGDFTPVDDLGRFVLGGFVRGSNSTIGAAITLDRLLKRTTSSNSTSSYLYQNEIVTTSNYLLFAVLCDRCVAHGYFRAILPTSSLALVKL